MRLKELIKSIETKKFTNGGNPEIAGVASDSRRVRPGFLFVAVKGANGDGHSYIQEAIARGAAAIVMERDLLVPADVPRAVAANGRAALSRLAAAFHGDPTMKLRVVGVTGTKGKTTTTYLLRSVVEAGGGTCALIGTISYQVGDRTIGSSNTTPDCLDLQSLAADAAAGGATHVVMEVSSHGLAQGRVEGIHFDAGILTNIASHEHLDYHRTFGEYVAAKTSFFERYLAASRKTGKAGIVNLDDPCARRVLQAVRRAGLVPVTFGRHRRADVRLTGWEARRDGGVVRVETEGSPRTLTLRLRGRGNVYNALAAAAYARFEGIPMDAVEAGLARVESVPGRFESVSAGQPFDVIVDYAHTEASLRNLLASVRDLRPRRIVTVFGCGGDRDRSKRPLMGAVAAALSDAVILTSDNPRSEDPAAIIRDIERGIPLIRRRKCSVVPDRREAIRSAVAAGGEGDCVVIAGKGHEVYQILKDTVVPFDDREEARKALAERGWNGPR